MKGYRFAIDKEGYILAFDLEFRKELYSRYVRENNLSEENVWDAFADWTIFNEDDDEKPEPLPPKYTGDIYKELQEIYIDLSCLQTTTDEDLEIVFEDIHSVPQYYDCYKEDYVDIPYDRICNLLIRMGYQIEQETEDAETVFVVY